MAAASPVSSPRRHRLLDVISDEILGVFLAAIISPFPPFSRHFAATFRPRFLHLLNCVISFFLHCVTKTAIRMVKEFTLDFSGQSGVPSQWGIKIDQVVKWFFQQAGRLEGLQLTEDHLKKGVFSVKAYTKETEAALASFVLKAEKGGKSFQIPLREKRRRTKPPVWVTIHRTGFGPMEEVENSYFDKLFENYGATIENPTERQTHRGTNYWTGKRRVFVEIGDVHVPRQHTWMGEDGSTQRWFLTYRGQPFSCNKCDDLWHENGNCPKWEENKKKENLEGTQKFVFFSNSQYRLATDTKDVRFDVIGGAKVGHVANHVNNDVAILPNADVIVVAPGNNNCNDGDGKLEEMKAAALAQSSELSKVLHPYSEANKKLFLVDPSMGPLPEDSHQSRFLRAEMRRCATRSGADFIPLDHVNMEPDDMSENDIHLNEKGTRKIFNEIRRQILEKIGVDVLGDFVIAKKPYAGIKRSHYKVGCPRCTFFHPTKGCPPLISINDATNAPLPSAGAFWAAAPEGTGGDASPVQ